MTPKNSEPRRSGTQATAASQPARTQTKALATVSVLVLALVAAWMLVPAARGDKTMPDELLGIWTTAAPTYADRALEIRPTLLIFHTGERTFRLHAVRRVVREDRGGSSLYTVEYADGDAVETLSFQYVRAANPAIRLRNQSFVWRREAGK